MPASEIVYVLVVLLGIAMLITGTCRNLPVPFTVILVLVGMLLGQMSHQLHFMEPLQGFNLSPEIMLFVFLPALIFESGFALDARQMIKDLPPILILAIPAMLMSTFVVGLGIWWALDVKLIVALVFGALISATDPVAVVALFKELGAPNRLNVLVEGESLLNDATAIVAFTILLGIAVEGGGIGWSDIDNVFLDFLRVFIGGALFGVLLGFVVCELLYRMGSGISVILTSSIIIAYASFVIAEHSFHVSGVMAVVGSAVALRRFGVTRFRQDTTHSISEVWEVIALCCNSLLFLLVGLSVSTGSLFNQLGPIFIAIALVLSARALSIYSLVPLAVKWFKLPHISLGERHIMWWGGLKGGLAIAVVLSIPADLPERQFLFEVTLGIVLFTLLISAPTIRPLMHFLGLSEFSRGEELEYRNSLHFAEETSQKYLSGLASSKIIPRGTVAPLQEQIRQTYSSGVDESDMQAHEDDEYFAEFRAYRVERESMKSLYETGVISQYIYLDMNNSLHAVQESLRLGEGRVAQQDLSEELTLFQRLEILLLGKIREKNWLAGWLSRYQEQRTVHRLQRDLAHILVSDDVISMLNRQEDLLEEARDKIISVHEERKKYYRKQLKQIRKYYPTFYLQYLERLTTRSMINSGWNRIKTQFAHGDLSAKGFNLIKSRVEAVMREVDESPLIFSKTVGTISEYLEDIEMFNELTDKDYDFLEANATIVTFLAGDTIMGRFETGEDFYLLVDGKATVWIKDAFSREQFMAELLKGDFMGESALLAKQKHHRHIRSATVKAETPCTLIRVSPDTMTRILWKYPKILMAIREINEARLSVRPKSTDKLRVYKPGKGKN
ncbi:MAG: cyclic nucleotide-binding domain-containing protein [Gammaproteobacteria bacterium]|nr:cyclic nucleotide-binding domain-containing protein [Gammaproteobacteria bacterium]